MIIKYDSKTNLLILDAGRAMSLCLLLHGGKAGKKTGLCFSADSPEPSRTECTTGGNKHGLGKDD